MDPLEGIKVSKKKMKNLNVMLRRRLPVQAALLLQLQTTGSVSVKQKIIRATKINGSFWGLK